MTGREHWRILDPMYVTRITNKIAKRAEEGEEKYGQRFVGEPLEQLEEELLDALFYVFYLRRKLEHTI